MREPFQSTPCRETIWHASAFQIDTNAQPNCQHTRFLESQDTPISFSMDKQRSVWLIDQSACRRSALEKLLLSKGLEVATYATPTEFLSRLPSFGVVLVYDSFEVVRELQSSLGPKKTGYPHIVYTDHPDWRRGVNAMHCGAVDYLMVPCEPEDILASINSIEIRHEPTNDWFTLSQLNEDKLSVLTRRERQVLEGVIAGFTNRSIGKQLGISPRTVEIHRANMMRKMDARNSFDVIRFAYESQIWPENKSQTAKNNLGIISTHEDYLIVDPEKAVDRTSENQNL